MGIRTTTTFLFLVDLTNFGSKRIECRKIVNLLAETKLVSFCIGALFFENKIDSPTIHFHKDFESFSKELNKDYSLENNLILIKGSRGMALERVLDLL